MQQIAVIDTSPERFAPCGTEGSALDDGAHGPGDVALDLSQGGPHFYLMRLEGRGTVFSLLARHNRVTQCLHAGPYFAEARRTFYNLELADTNTKDYTVYRLGGPVAFAP
jgi:hypothetical protein